MGTKSIQKFKSGKFVANLTLETQEELPFTIHLFIIDRDSAKDLGNWYEGKIIAHRKFKPGEKPNPGYIKNILKKMENDPEYLKKYEYSGHGSGVW